MIPKFRVNTRGGKLFFEDRISFDRYILSLKDDAPYELTVKEKKTKRSLQQNKYYWGVPIELISEHTGHTPDEVHELLKTVFLKKHLDIEFKNGSIERYSIVRSTTSLNTKEMEEYQSNIRVWASSELGLYIPEPNEVELT